MEITKKTKVKEVLPLLFNEGMMDKILEDVKEYPLEKPILSMTIGEFIEIVLNEQSFVKKIMKPNERAYIAFGRLKSFKKEMEQLMKYIQKFQIKQSSEEKQAAINIDFPDFLSKILLTTTQFFRLHSFKEAESIPLADYILILKDQVSSIQYQRNYSKIMEQKSKNGKH